VPETLGAAAGRGTDGDSLGHCCRREGIGVLAWWLRSYGTGGGLVASSSL
jgi:hypothetical protein